MCIFRRSPEANVYEKREKGKIPQYIDPYSPRWMFSKKGHTDIDYVTLTSLMKAYR